MIGLLFFFALACTALLPNAGSPQKTDTKEPSPTRTTAPLGYAKSNPVPLRKDFIIDEMSISVAYVVSPADQMMEVASSYNPSPDPGNRYIFVNLSVVCKKAKDPCHMSGYEFGVWDSVGAPHSPETFVIGVTGLFDPYDFRAGSTKSGFLVFQAPLDDNRLVMKYSGYSQEIFFALYE